MLSIINIYLSLCHYRRNKRRTGLRLGPPGDAHAPITASHSNTAQSTEKKKKKKKEEEAEEEEEEEEEEETIR
jgi:hypothetical protein